MARLGFWGAAGTVTGSKYLLEAGNEKLLLDYGMFQGGPDLVKLNSSPSPVPPDQIQWLVVTHAHIDHSGLIPRLVKQGFRGRIFCTPPTADLLKILLLDSAHLQQEDYEHHQKKGCKGPDCHWAEPLYSTDDVNRTLDLITIQPYGRPKPISPVFTLRFLNVGHILGSSMAEIAVQEEGRSTKVLFSGDVGRYKMPLNIDPQSPPPSDYMVMESTYGDTAHPHEDVFTQIEGIAKDCIQRGGVLVIPAFAVGRAQQIILILRELIATKRIPALPIHVDSPMAVDVTQLYRKYPEELDVDIHVDGDPSRLLYGPGVFLHKTVEESKALNDLKGPAVIIASSGMLTGGRILHHLINRLPDPKNLLMLAGYQAEGSLARLIQDGAKTANIYHQEVQIRAKVEDMRGLSAHADYEELLRWISPLKVAPRTLFLTHGEEAARKALGALIEHQRGWKVYLPKQGETVELG